MTSPTARNLGVCGLFFVSGALALVYEVLWQRRFGLLFGSAPPATAAVLAAYFAGLALGSVTLGRMARRWNRPLRSYAILELLIALGAILVPILLDSFAPLHRTLSQSWAASPAVLLAGKVLMGFVALALPTICMGGTLPILAAQVDGHERRVGWAAGRLYLANTLGAAVGALVVPFVLLRWLGIGASEWVAVAGNVAIGITAWMWDRQSSHPTPPSAAATRVRPEALRQTGFEARGSGWWLGALSGWVTLTLQVLWNRAFAQVHENSIYSFAVIVSLFVFALALGAQAARYLLDRGQEPRAILGWAWLAGGALSAIGPWLFLRLTHGLSYIPASGGWGAYGIQLAGLAAAVLLLPIGLLGIGLPAIMEECCRRHPGKPVSSVLGGLLAMNVMGSVLGALCAGFLLPAWLGLWNSLVGIAALLMIGGLTQVLRITTTPKLGKAACAAVALIEIVFTFHSAAGWPRLQLLSAQQERLVHVAEGTYGIVSVVDRGDSRRLKLNNHYMLGGTLSTGDERMQAHLPLLLHPAPHQVAFLGVGTGITAGGSTFHPLEEVVAIELVPEVIAAARSSFREANAGVLDSPRTRVILEDARNYLRTASQPFDVIISDLVVPWRQGEGSLFTLEHFIAARERLAPGGLFCQWLPLFQLSETEVTILVRTFLKAFPKAYVWRGDFSPHQPALALIGARDPFQLNSSVVGQRIQALASDPQNPHLKHALAIWMHWVGILEAPDLPPEEQRINREDRPWVEVLGPLLHAGESQSKLLTGRRLQAWIRGVQERSVARISELGAQATAGIEAGNLMSEFALSLSEGNQRSARQAQSRLRERLPAEVFRSLFEGDR